MSHRPFRFIHAADFHLELPPQGIAEVPEHLRTLFLDAAYSAAQRVFDAVVAEEAELLVLSGDLLHPQYTGLRGPLFLCEQFARLAQREISVYWAGGGVDPPEIWPAAFPLPANVHVFPRGRTSELVHQRDGLPLARLVGASRDGQRPIRPADFEPDPTGAFTVAVAHGSAEIAALQSRKIDYWALGGGHQRSTLYSSPQAAHDPGSPQGRRPEEPGPHGCTLVHVDEQRQTRISLMPTDVLRWFSERIAIDDDTTRAGLETLLRERVRTLMETTPKMDLLISWKVVGGGPLAVELRRGSLAAELLGWLRTEFGFGPPAAWSVALEAESAAGLPAAWYEQETIRGDFLRALHQCEVNPEEPLELDAYLSETHLAGSLASATAFSDKAIRQQVLREAALLGSDLLSGEEAQS